MPDSSAVMLSAPLPEALASSNLIQVSTYIFSAYHAQLSSLELPYPVHKRVIFLVSVLLKPL